MEAKTYKIPKLDQKFVYFLGFLSADGYVWRSGISIQLRNSDSDIINEFYKWFESKKFFPKIDYKYIKEKKYIKLAIYSTFFSKQIQKYGIFQNKSKTIEWSKHIPDDLIRHYIRGYFDGNGCLIIRRNNFEVGIASGSKVFLERFSEVVDEEINVGKKKVYEKKKTTYELYYYANQAKEFLQWIYKGHCFFKLERKYLKFKSFKKVTNPFFWSNKEINYLMKNYEKQTDSWKEIAIKLGRSNRAVSKKIWELNLTGKKKYEACELLSL